MIPVTAPVTVTVTARSQGRLAVGVLYYVACRDCAVFSEHDPEDDDYYGKPTCPECGNKVQDRITKHLTVCSEFRTTPKCYPRKARPPMDKFTQAYSTCALWSSTDDDGKPLDRGRDVSDLHQNSRSRS